MWSDYLGYRDFDIYSPYIKYFESTQDAHAHFYEFALSPYESFAFKGTVPFGSEKYQLKIVDQFGGKRPFLFNLNFLQNPHAYPLNFVITVILDSHVVSGLHRFFFDPHSLRPDMRRAINDFLVCACKIRFDYNPIFYLTESLCKSSVDEFIASVTPVVASILHLHSMDEDYFISNGKIRLKPDAVKFYCTKYQRGNLFDCAAAWIESFIKECPKSEYGTIIKFSYACLLKMVLIHKKDNRCVCKKLNDFEDFMENEIGLRFARESQLAAYYFADLAGAFINTQSSMKLDDAKHNLKATAWDIFLLRQPEFLLRPANLPEVNLAYICTAENKLAEFGSLFAIERFVARSDSHGGGGPAVSFDLSLLQEKVGDTTLDKLLRNNAERHLNRFLRHKIESISTQKLDWLIEDLEVQLSYFCRG